MATSSRRVLVNGIGPPPGWPEHWKFPAPPWPPGWPLNEWPHGSYKLMGASEAVALHTPRALITVEPVDEDALGMPDMAGYYVKLIATCGPNLVKLREDENEPWSAICLSQIKKLDKGRYGVQQGLFFNMAYAPTGVIKVAYSLFGIAGPEGEEWMDYGPRG